MSKSFHDLEQSYGSTAVTTTTDDGLRVTGRLTVAGRETTVDVEANGYLGRRKSEEGWFDLTLTENGDRKIHLHNAIVQLSSDSPAGRGHFRHKIYPNIIVFDAQNLAPGNRVQQISFRLKNLIYFFWYEMTEEYDLGDRKEAFVELLSKLREDRGELIKDSGIAREFDFLDPERIFLAHRSPDKMEFTVGDITYSIFMGSYTRGTSYNSIDVRHEPMATITFPEPVTIQEATSAVWKWNRFFNQIARMNLELLEVSVCGSLDERAPMSAVYLTNERWAPSDTDPHHEFHPAAVPHSSWAERDKLKTLMMHWLECETDRHRYRVFVDGVIKQRFKADGFRQIAALCAAVDSLGGMSSESKLEKSTLAEMVKSAAEHVPDIPQDRIKAALGSLSSTSLRFKIEKMTQVVAPGLTDEAVARFSKQVKRLRNIAAHGIPEEPLQQPLLMPVCDALLALCILYDQELSGLDTTVTEFQGRLVARQDLSWALRIIEQNLT